MNFELTPEQTKLIDSINFASSKLLKVNHIVDFENYIHFLNINIKLLNLNFNQMAENNMSLSNNTIENTIDLFNQKNEKNV